LEDQGRDMATAGQGDTPVKGKPPRSSDLTVMIVGQVGKSRSFRISSRIMTWASIFFAFYILSSILVFNGYFKELRASRAQSALLERLQKEIQETRRALNRSKQHLALLEEAIDDLGASQQTPTKVSTPKPAIQKKEAVAPEQPAGQAARKRADTQQVGIEDLSFSREGSKLKVTFRLVNRDKEDNPASGYVHIIAVHRGTDPPQQWAYPDVALRNGMPTNYKKGQLFFIKRFRTMRGEYLLDPGSETPSSVRVLVYDNHGNLILEREYEVGNVS
jgi:uncharacterized coiled-coil protein SlyX